VRCGLRSARVQEHSSLCDRQAQPDSTAPARLRSCSTRWNGRKMAISSASGTPGPKSRTALQLGLLHRSSAPRPAARLGVGMALRSTFSKALRSSSRSPRRLRSRRRASGSGSLAPSPPDCNPQRFPAGMRRVSIGSSLRKPGSPSTRVTCNRSPISCDMRSTSFLDRAKASLLAGFLRTSSSAKLIVGKW